MTVYVDTLVASPRSRRWPFPKACHLFAGDVDELHRFAARIGLRRSWFQDRQGFPHYDLNEGRRRAALRAGASAVTRRELVEFMRAPARRSE